MTSQVIRLLVLSNMWPSEQKPYSGVFVKNQVDQYSGDKRIEVDYHCLRRSFTGRIGSALKYIAFFASFAKKHLFRPYDVLHIHYFFPTAILGVAYKFMRPRTSLVVTFHGTDITHFMSLSVLRALGRWLIQHVDVSIAVSASMADKIEEVLGVRCQHIFSAGVRADLFYPESSSRKDFDFIFVGSFIERKGFDLLIDACKRISTAKLRLAFIGSGNLIEKIDELNECHEAMTIENLSQSELREAFSRSRYHVLPSRYEPFGLVVTEAMFCGVPVIGSRVGGIPDQIQDEVTGWLVEPGNAEALQKTMMAAIEIPEYRYEAMVQACLQSNRENALSVVCDKQLLIYEQQMEHRRGKFSE